MGCSLSCSRGSSTETGETKHEEAADNDDQSDMNKKSSLQPQGSPTEDVLYASIDHNNLKPERQPREDADSDCDYAVVRIPEMRTDTAKHKSSEDCSDDYVLMG
ncbi:uncharacterized protein si:ch211-214p13.7 isoform X1 [Triplophysa rosa]|uniref:uncharacterized protein si:ch211-214p13.7 isoform X1 n=1 Tax=Triplophysa rosa TaxID=992332 RepID=UPI0025463662|nr:uncharacterized protein si:ch211-214p13.7 isoform X1 [Triplophysa rosa]